MLTEDSDKSYQPYFYPISNLQSVSLKRIWVVYLHIISCNKCCPYISQLQILKPTKKTRNLMVQRWVVDASICKVLTPAHVILLRTWPFDPKMYCVRLYPTMHRSRKLGVNLLYSFHDIVLAVLGWPCGAHMHTWTGQNNYREPTGNLQCWR